MDSQFRPHWENMYSRNYLLSYPTGDRSADKALRLADRSYSKILELLGKLHRIYHRLGLPVHLCADVVEGTFVLRLYKNSDMHRWIYIVNETSTVREMETYLRRYLAKLEKLSATDVSEHIAEIAARADVEIIPQTTPNSTPAKHEKTIPLNDRSWLNVQE